MNKAHEIVDYLRAGFSIIYIKANELERIHTEIEPLITSFEKRKYTILHWDLTTDKGNPVEPIGMLSQVNEDAVIFCYNYHWFIDKPPVIQHLQNNISKWANTKRHFVIVSHEVKIPAELEKDIIVLDLELPKAEAINVTIDFYADYYKPNTVDRNRIVTSSKGLTMKEMKDVFSLCLIRSGKIDPFMINQYKAEAFSKTGFITIIEPKRKFKDIIGLDLFKEHIKETICNPKAKGLIAIGPPGCGKTSIAEAIVGETGKIGFALDMGKLFSKYVGETGKNVDMVIDILKAVGHCVVLVDEWEKQFAGAGGSGDTDSGNTRRSLSKWLNFLQDRPEGIFIIATANSFNGIPPEYLRPGRWDTSPFYFDLPSAETRIKILEYYVEKAKLGVTKKDLAAVNKLMDNFSGAEIEALVHIASMRKRTLKEAKAFIIPIAQTMGAEINALRDWAKTRCIYSEENVAEQVGRQLDI